MWKFFTVRYKKKSAPAPPLLVRNKITNVVVRESLLSAMLWRFFRERR